MGRTTVSRDYCPAKCDSGEDIVPGASFTLLREADIVYPEVGREREQWRYLVSVPETEADNGAGPDMKYNCGECSVLTS